MEKSVKRMGKTKNIKVGHKGQWKLHTTSSAGSVCTNWNTKRLYVIIRKHFFAVQVTEHWHRFCGFSILGHLQKSSGHGPGHPDPGGLA